jgi:hypothetical protein
MQKICNGKTMNLSRDIGISFLLLAVICLLQSRPGFSQSAPSRAPSPQSRDGQHDFDFELGTWKTELSRLLRPLTGSATWVEYTGTSVVRKIWDGRANLVELEVSGPTGHIEALSLRLYDPQAHQWSLNTATAKGGMLSVPTVGEFKNGRGEFYDQEPYDGRTILVRNLWLDITPNSCRFEQAFSNDGGKTWETNWIARDTRVPHAQAKDGSGGAGAQNISSPPGASRQSLEDAWWTGPMLANSAETLPPGHFLVEPYVYDEITPHANGFGSLTYILYGLANRFTVGAIPTFGFDKLSEGPGSSGVGRGDLTALAQYRLTQFHEHSRIPTTSFEVQETFPTGKYDRLGDRPSNGFGSGAFTTTLSLNSQTYFWLPNSRLVRMRFNVSEALSTGPKLEGVSVYGTGAGFLGHAHPGSSFFVDVSWEYSLARSWALALDATYRHNGASVVNGVNLSDPGGAQNPVGVRLISGSSEAFGFAPAIEYSWKHNLGVLLGARVIAIGHHTATTITPALAINYVH